MVKRSPSRAIVGVLGGNGKLRTDDVGVQMDRVSSVGDGRLTADEGRSMKSSTYCLKLESTRAPEFIDITQGVQDCVADANVQHGFVVVFSRHTTAAIKVNENEPLLLQDMESFLERIAPRNGSYQHNDFTVRTVNMTEDECPNGHAHCQQLLLGTSETIPIVEGMMQFGRWQSIFMIELDHARPREVLVQILGA